MTATVAAPQGNQFGVLLAIFLVITFTTVVVYWNHERRMDRSEKVLHRHDKQLATLAGRIQSLADFLGVDINDPVEDDSPGHEEDVMGEHDADTETDIPIVPGEPTEPMAVVNPTPAVQARRDAAWDQQRPSPVPRELMTPEAAEEQRAKRAAWVEEQIAKFDYTGGRR